jgi:hypothetical protein
LLLQIFFAEIKSINVFLVHHELLQTIHAKERLDILWNALFYVRLKEISETRLPSL